MTSFATASWHRLRRLLRRRDGAAPLPSAAPQVLDGLTAVAAIEAALGDGAVLGAGFPAATGARAWATRRDEHPVNELGAPLCAAEELGPRAALAATMGMALAGQRATVFLSGCDLDAAGDVLGFAAGQRAPFVAHVGLRAPARHAQALGSGHDAWHAVADRGAVLLMATSVQDAVDLAVIGRRIAERLLLPVVIGMDAAQTALAAQDVVLPGPELLRAVVGDPADHVDAPTEAQRMLFGERRRRLPRLYDVERPMLLGPRQGPESWGVAAAGRGAFLDEDAGRIVAEAFDAFAEATGRRCDPLVVQPRHGDAAVIVAQGAAVETALALARRGGAGRIGVLGVRALRPLPAAAIAEAIGGGATVLVLERLDAPLADDGPLTRELRDIVARCAENAAAGRAVHEQLPSIAARQAPRLVGVRYGLGGLPLRGADLATLVARAETIGPGPVLLGVGDAGDEHYPKRQALADALRRSFPRLGALTLRSEGPAVDLRPEGATTIAVVRSAGGPFEALAGEVAGLVQAVAGGHVRSRPELTWRRHAARCVDLVTHAGKPLLDPGDDLPADIVILAPGTDLAARPGLAAGAAVLALARDWSDLPDGMARRPGAATVHVVAPPDEGEPSDEAALRERLLGGLATLLQTRLGAAVPGSPKVAAAREAMHEGVAEPRRAALIESFRRGMETLGILATDSAPAAPAAADHKAPAPRAARRLARREQTLDSLPRFWDHLGVLYGDDDAPTLAPDPYLATGVMPPLSSTLTAAVGARAVLPVFDPAECDGDGRLWTSCPDASVRPVALSPRALIDAGLALAAEDGRPADALRGIAARLAQRAGKLVAGGQFAGGPLGDLLRQAFASIIDKAADTPERRATLEEALAALVGAVGALPVARTRPFFDDAESGTSGSGELFSLIVDPDTCRSPELVLAAAGGHGLRAGAATAEAIEEARGLVRLWERLPDVSGATIERVRNHPDVGPLAAMTLARGCLLAMAGGDGAEAGSGARLALRHVLAAAEFHLQPRLQAHLDTIESLRDRLATAMRELLADALPTDDLDALAEGLAALGRDDLDLAALSRTLDSAVLGRQVDGARLGRMVEAARGLAELHWRVSRGPDGLGRARVGLALAGGSVASWSAVFPHNPFAGPVAVDAVGEPAALVRGLLAGHLQHMVAGFRLERWAALELDRPQDAARMVQTLRSLGFADLTADERALCPPLLLVGDGADIGRGLAGLVGLLDSGLPVKIVALSGCGGDADGGLATEAQGDFPARERFDLALLALLGRRAYVAQTSAAAPEHFADSVLGAMAFDGPAFVHVHAPSPERHGFPVAALHDQARRAVACRAVPLLRFDPSRGGVFGACLDLTGNPSLDAAWHADEAGRPLTPVDWAVTERRFAEHLRPLAADAPTPTSVVELLELPVDRRAGRTAFVAVADADGERRLAVRPALVEDADRRARLWRTLQELAGVVTPFTEQVRTAAERDLGAGHRRAIDELTRRHEQELAELRAGFEAEAVRRVTSGLMTLAGYGERAGGAP